MFCNVMQCCALIVTGKISEEFIGECWTCNVSVLTKLQFKSVLVFKLQFLDVGRASLRENKHDVFTLQFPFQSQNKNPGKPYLIVQYLIQMLYKGQSYTKGH